MDWCAMPRWARTDAALRYASEMYERGRALKGKGWSDVLSAVVRRLLGLDG